MIVPVMAISKSVLTRQIYSKETNGAHAHNRDRVPLSKRLNDDDDENAISKKTCLINCTGHPIMYRTPNTN